MIGHGHAPELDHYGASSSPTSGRPPLGRATARLADGTRVRWDGGQWSASPPREMHYGEVSAAAEDEAPNPGA